MSGAAASPEGECALATAPALGPREPGPNTEEVTMETAHEVRSGSAALRIPLGRRGWLLIVLAIVAAGMALNWGWLTAIGAAPLILSLAPCALMCAAGLCMSGSKSCATKSAPDTARD